MNYSLVEPLENSKEKILEYKLKSILEYAEELSQEEIVRVKEYVKQQILIDFKNYRVIFIDNKIVGCVLIENHNDGVLLDEIYLEENYRNKGIGTDIIKKTLLSNKVVYLWVYKRNLKAISLYQKMGFRVIKETETRYYMKHFSSERKNDKC